MAAKWPVAPAVTTLGVKPTDATIRASLLKESPTVMPTAVASLKPAASRMEAGPMPTVSPTAMVGALMAAERVTTRVSSKKVVTVQTALPMAPAPSRQVLPPPSGSTVSMLRAVIVVAFVAESKMRWTRSPAWRPAPAPLASSAKAPSKTGEGAASAPCCGMSSQAKVAINAATRSRRGREPGRCRPVPIRDRSCPRIRASNRSASSGTGHGRRGARPLLHGAADARRGSPVGARTPSGERPDLVGRRPRGARGGA